DAHFREAILSSAPAHLDGLLADVVEHPPATSAETKLVSEYFALAGASRAADGAVKALQKAVGPWRYAALGALLDSASRKSVDIQPVISKMDDLFATAQKIALDANA